MGCGCGCAGDDAGALSMGAVSSRDPLFARRVASASGQRIGLIAVWPEQTRDLILRIDPSMVATDAAVHACTALSSGEVLAWSGFFQAWKAFVAEGVSAFFSAHKWDEAEAYRLQLAGWQDELATKCAVPGPKIVPTVAEVPVTDLASAAKWIAAAAIAVSIVYGIRTVLK